MALTDCANEAAESPAVQPPKDVGQRFTGTYREVMRG
jgi:hypothetical protein